MQSNNALHEFMISKESLAEIVEEINYSVDQQYYGTGIQYIVSALKTNINTGIIGDQEDLHSRRKAFGSNLITTLQEQRPPQKNSIKHFLLNSLRDTTLILLLCCAMLSVVIGVKSNGVKEAVNDAVLISLSVSIVVSFGAFFRFLKVRWIIKKSLKQKRVIWVVRNSIFLKIPESEVVVGDIVYLQTGDRIPADGISIDEYGNFQHQPYISLFTGAKVINGNFRMLVMSVGENTERSRLIKNQVKNHDDHQNYKPKLELLDAVERANSKLEKIWLSLSLLLLILQLIRCFVSKPKQTSKDHNFSDPKGMKNTLEDFMDESIRQNMRKERSKVLMNNGFITMLCIIILASRDGLPLAMFISLLYASNKMKSCLHAIIQKLPASATIALVTTICCCCCTTGKTTHDLVLQHAEMAELWVGFRLIDELHTQLHSEVVDILREGIFVHTKVVCGYGHDHDQDMLLLSWARAVLGFNMEFQHHVQYEDNKDRNLSCLVIKKVEKLVHVHWKGAPEIIVFMCSHYYNANGSIEALDDDKRIAFLRISDNLVDSKSHLSCFAFAYKQELIEDDDESTAKTVMISIKPLEDGLILLGLVGLKNPYTTEVREAIQDCRESGVDIKFLVEDGLSTARIMALHSGLLGPDQDDHKINNINGSAGLIIDAADFRSSSQEERLNMIENIRVMANSSPADKLLMIQCLRQKGEIVAATASCIRDSPLLKEADVGIYMHGGDEDDEISKEDSDIVLLNNKFSQIPGIIFLGKRVCRNLEKLIILQLTLEISAFAINFIPSATAMNSEVLMSSFQIIWINLIMEVLGSLAVAITTVHAQNSSSSHAIQSSDKLSKRLITWTMCRRIAVQSIFQVSIILILGTKGKDIFQVNDQLTLKTMVYNCFAFCQIFSLISAIDGGIFMGKNWLFVGVVGIIGVLQVFLIVIMGVVAGWGKIDLRQWCIGIGIASVYGTLSWAANWTAEKLFPFIKCL